MKKALIAGVVVVLLAIAAVFIYAKIEDNSAPAKLSLGDRKTSTTVAAPESLDGDWKVTPDSKVGYRVVEDFIGGIANSEAVGRTSDVTGSLTLAAATVPAAEFEAKVASITSDRSMRDGRFQGIMDTQQFPTATFTVTKPIDLGSVPADGAEITASATGDLTLHGTKKSVTFDVKAKRVGGEIEVNGSIPVVFADYGIAQPTSPIVDVRDNGQLEFLLVFTKS